jgi:ubiquinone/menaquinone biosynthesis C-methylase UbiE
MAAYAESAELYDALYRWKDYAAEAHTLQALIAANARRPVATLLDVACGTGAHLAHLKRHYRCAGLDLSAGLLGVARQRHPELSFTQGDMRDFELGQTFDVVVCLFSAIGYVETVEGLRQAVAAMARHVSPGGVLVVEPWFLPDEARDRYMSVLTVEDPDRKIVRASVSRIRDGVTELDFHYLVLTPEGTEHFTEMHRLGVFTDAAYRSAFTDAGLEVTRDPHGLDGRGLYLGVRPA